MVSTRAPIGHLGMASVPLCFNQGCRGLIPNGAVDAAFYFHVMTAEVTCF